jgi:hypothetical protein
MKGSHPLYAEMELSLRNLAILINPECWFDGQAILKEMNHPEIEATKNRIREMLEEVASESAPYWLIESDFDLS